MATQYQLAKKQHILPSASIKRFAGLDGKVAVRRIGATSEERKAPTAKRFCTDRTWDQRAETGFMRDIEEAFQPLADRVSVGLVSFSVEESTILTTFHALWILRQYYHQNRLSDPQIAGVIGEPFTENTQDRLEAIGAASVISGEPMPARFLAGFTIQMQLAEILSRIGQINWGIVKAAEGEFLCPDTYGELPMIPIGPKICLFGGRIDTQLSRDGVAELNHFAQNSATKYYFARDFAACPF